jgi:hypothetical protein
MYWLARALQEALYDAHVRDGGKKASRWLAAGVGLLCGLTVVALILGGAFVSDSLFTEGLGKKVTFGRDENVYYAEGATEDDARRLGRALQDQGVFDGASPKDVRLTRPGGRFVVQVVLARGAWHDPENVASYEDLRRRLSEDVFSGAPVELRLCDEELTTKKTLR